MKLRAPRIGSALVAATLLVGTAALTGSPATGVREPMARRPSAIPASTARQRSIRLSARRRVSASSCVNAVTKARASKPCG